MVYIFQKIKKQWDAHIRAFRKDDRGIAMVVAMVVGAVIMAFCLSMLLVTYTLFSQTSRQTTQLQCKLFAQSYTETLMKEFGKKPEDSELLTYLGERIKATGADKWISKDEEDLTNPGSGVSEITFVFNENSISGNLNYEIQTTFTYESNNVEDDDNTVVPIDDDDQDEDETPSGAGAGAGGGAGATPPTGGGSYIVHATVCCMKGNAAALSDRDAQVYTIESDFILNVND